MPVPCSPSTAPSQRWNLLLGLLQRQKPKVPETSRNTPGAALPVRTQMERPPQLPAGRPGTPLQWTAVKSRSRRQPWPSASWRPTAPGMYGQGRASPHTAPAPRRVKRLPVISDPRDKRGPVQGKQESPSKEARNQRQTARPGCSLCGKERGCPRTTRGPTQQAGHQCECWLALQCSFLSHPEKVPAPSASVKACFP